MKTSHWIAACLACLGVAVAAHAQEQPSEANGAALLASCRAGKANCGAYLQGVLDMMIVARHDECGAPRYDRDRLRAAYLRWIEQNSYFQSVHMVAGAERALTEAWPCRKS
jgi:hypothetical protein